ncbi:protein translocase subunit SecF [Paludibaculum fermentans]|uniref:protein translocase subunit SecF n=1 Tax=Paludibaculum fermentans TaxID=1473598 RepID=UPI003EBE3EB7
MELFKNTNIDFLGKKGIFIGASLVLTVVGLASWIGKGGLKYGIDFTGGANITVKFATTPPVDKLRSEISSKIPGEISVQEIPGQNSVIIGTPLKDEIQLNSERSAITETLEASFGQSGGKFDFNNASVQTLADRLRGPMQSAGVALNEEQLQSLAKNVLDFKNTPPRSGIVTNLDQLSGVSGVTPQILGVIKQECFLTPFSIIGAEVVGPKIGAELRSKAVLATLYALGGMLVYLAFRFEFIYGLAAVIAVFHDVIITLGLFSLFNKEISLNVVAALLTLVGYSMNDTIVVFDRIRETLKLSRKELGEEIVNLSINQTLSRTILTSGLTFISAISLLLFGGPVLNGFAFALVAGIIVGTYSSIFVASPILVFWHNYIQARKKAPAAAQAK